MNHIIKSEFARKGIHLSNAIIPLSYYYFFMPNKIDMIIVLAAILIFSFIIEIYRKNSNKLSVFFSNWLDYMMREKEKKGEITGATWVFVGALFTILLVPDPFNIVSLLFLSFGDTFAAIIGMKYPFIKIGRKTLSGSIAGFFACITVGLVIAFPINFEIIIFGAFTAMFIELLPLPVNDNVSIPIFSGLSMYYFSLIV